MRIFGLIAGFLGALILCIGAVLAVQIFQQVGVLCPDDPRCEDARTAGVIAVAGTVSGLVTMVVGLLLRRRGTSGGSS